MENTTTVVQPFHRPLFLLTESEDLESSLRHVIERPFALYRVRDWAELKSALSSAPQTAVCFADAVHSAGRNQRLAEGLREIAGEFPLLAVVACLRVEGHADTETLLVLQDWGVADILDLVRETSSAAVARRLAEVKGVWAQRIFMRALPRALTTRARTLLETVADVAAEGGHVPELARALNIDERTVPRWCAAAGVPHARRLFSWIRLLLAADLLDDRRRSIEAVARASGYSSAASLKSTTKKFTTYSPSELRERGAFQAVATLVRDEFREARDALHRSKHKENSWYN
ncbi:MAG TPA: helix-turn-helix domain-containing protein [Longimicrobium sp.]|nr:helix-turn-helix domain-containing protein [Longimicrobium sp.]